jgi:hypothetical protein
LTRSGRRETDPDGMDILAIALTVVFFAVMLALIEGLDRV